MSNIVQIKEIKEKNEFDRNYAGEIALECEKLEGALKLGLEDYDNSARVLGKAWYSVGLENNDADKENDGANKRNILLRLIDGVIKFIKMIGQKIVAWFKACKAAIMKFFGKDTVDPKLMAGRFHTLVEGLSKEDVDHLVAGLSHESKAVLAEAIDKDYSRDFSSLYDSYLKLARFCSSTEQVAANARGFAELKEKSDELKAHAKNGKLHENADESLKHFFTTGGESIAISNVGMMFEGVQHIHEQTAHSCEQLLKKIPEDDLHRMEGTDVDHKRREMIKLVSDYVKVGSDIVLKVNNHMQAVAMLYSAIGKYRMKKIVHISM